MASDPGMGDLSDDVADIHRDLTEGLSLYDQGYSGEAEWTFHHLFFHWGRHAASATAALQFWLTQHR